MGIESSPKIELGSPVSRSSEFYDMGFNTLGEACSGLALDGSEIERSIRCFYYSEYLGAPGETQEQVFESYQDVRRALGRDPVSPTEYSRVESKIRDARIANLELQKEEIEKKASEAMVELRSAEEEIKVRESVISRLKGESLEMKSNLESQIAGIKKKHKSRIEEIIEDSKKRLSNAVSEAVEREKERSSEERRSLLKEKEDEISKIRAEGEERYCRLQSHVESNFVSLSQYNALKLECDQLRDINRDNLVKLNNAENADYKSREEHHLEQIEGLRARLRKIESAYIAMEKAYKTYKARYKQLKQESKIKSAGGEKPGEDTGKGILKKNLIDDPNITEEVGEYKKASIYVVSVITTGAVLAALIVL